MLINHKQILTVNNSHMSSHCGCNGYLVIHVTKGYFLSKLQYVYSRACAWCVCVCVYISTNVCTYVCYARTQTHVHTVWFKSCITQTAQIKGSLPRTVCTDIMRVPACIIARRGHSEHVMWSWNKIFYSVSFFCNVKCAKVVIYPLH